MAAPRNRTSNSRKNTRRAHDGKRPVNTCTCSNCGKPHLPHRLCLFCGFYKNRSVVGEKTEE